MRINKTKNSAAMASITADDSRYKWGYAAFYRGERIVHTQTEEEKDALARRRNCLEKGWQDAADRIALSFIERGLYVVDIFEPEDTLPVQTIVEKKVVASNPFPAETFAAKEWERGFNMAFTHNLRKVRAEQKKGRKSAPTRRAGHSVVRNATGRERPNGNRKNQSAA